jgi:predicted nuclease of restriction endonuclease-like (RecB) superfamily
MSNKEDIQPYLQAVKELKEAILKSRYVAAKLVNKEMLLLYFFVGKYIAENSRNKYWGKGAIESISAMLQQELNGLRGFSPTNLKNMRIFYEQWFVFEPIIAKNLTLALFDFNTDQFRQMTSDEMKKEIRQIAYDEFEQMFFKVAFSHHLAIIQSVKELESRLFYLQKTVNEYLTYDSLRHHLKQQLHKNQGQIPHNFENTLSEKKFKQKAMMTFKDEMLLDFIKIEDADEEPDERILEQEIVLNIKKFIMALGTNFSFIGNQYRLLIDEEEYFIDLLFFNRTLQSLVAIELKKGKFKAEYVGKMNLYLSVLDEYIKQPHENPSIGIILCKERNKKIVEFAFRDTTKPMGVVTYKTQKDLPEHYKNSLPRIEDLKSLLD